MLGHLVRKNGGVQTAENDRHAEGAIGVGDLVGVEGPCSVGGQGDQVEIEPWLGANERHVVHLDVFHVHTWRGHAGECQQGQARQLGDDLTAVHELRQRDPQLDEFPRLNLDPGNGDQPDLHGQSP